MSLTFWKTDVLRQKEERGSRKIIYWGVGGGELASCSAGLASLERRGGWKWESRLPPPCSSCLPPWASAEGISLRGKAPGVASSSLQCPAQLFWFVGPDRLSQPHHLLPSRFLGIRKRTHGVAPYPCLALVHLCLRSGLRGSGQAESWDPPAEPWEAIPASPHMPFTGAIEISPETALGILGIFWPPVIWARRVHQGDSFKGFFPRFWWAFLEKKLASGLQDNLQWTHVLQSGCSSSVFTLD